MSRESNVTIYREVCVDLWRELHKLRGDHEALMQVMIEELPLDDRARVLQKYDLRRRRIYEDNLLNIEEKFLKLPGSRDSQSNMPLPDRTQQKRSDAPTTARSTKAHKKPKRAYLSFIATTKVTQ